MKNLKPEKFDKACVQYMSRKGIRHVDDLTEQDIRLINIAAYGEAFNGLERFEIETGLSMPDMTQI